MPGRSAGRPVARPAAWRRSVLLATLAPLVYYGRLLAIGLSRPDRDGGAGGRLATAPDPTGRDRDPAVAASARGTPTAAFTTALVAALLGLLAVATSAGAFDGPATASAPPASLPSPSPLVEPRASGEVPTASESP